MTARPLSLTSLSASLIVSAGMLETLSWDYQLIARPASLGLAVSLQAVFLGFMIAWLPARFGAAKGQDFDGMTETCFGGPVARLIRNFILPLWALTWLWWITSLTLEMLNFAWARDVYYPVPRIVPWAALAVVAGLTVPVASGPLSKLADSSVWMLKVSIAAILGAAIGYWQLAQELAAGARANAPVMGVDARVLPAGPLLWTIPPVLLLAAKAGSQRMGRVPLLRFVCLGASLPLALGTIAAVVTVAGGAETSRYLLKFPSYIGSIAIKRHVGWAQVLVLSFTMLMAAGFALHLLGRLISGSYRTIVCCLILLAGMACQRFDLVHVAVLTWQYSAAAFASMAGVFSAACANRSKGEFGARDRVFAVAAWIAGILIVVIPPILEHERPERTAQLAVMAGWLIAFVITLAARLLNRTKTPGSLPPPAP